MSEKVAFKKATGSALHEAGFTRRGQSWFLPGPDATTVLSLQKDDVGELYWVNFGIWLNALGTNRSPPEHLCHVRIRLDRLFPAKREFILDACTVNGDNELLSDWREFLKTEFVPFCLQCRDLQKLKALISSDRIPAYNTYVIARPILEITDQDLDRASRRGRQASTCRRYGSELLLTGPSDIVGAAKDLLAGIRPVHGLRHPPTLHTSGWYIWSGEVLSQDPDYFQPMHAVHLGDCCPKAEDFLGLAPGWRFLIADDYEDAWFDRTLLDVR